MGRLQSSLFQALTLGCFMLGCAAASSKPAGYAGDDARDFAKKHRAALEKDILTGSGPTLYDLAILANCQDIALMGRRLHKHREVLLGPGGTNDDAVAGEVAPSAAASGAVPGRVVPDEVVAERVVRFLEDNRELRCLDLELGKQRLMAAGTRHIGPSRAQVSRRGGTP
jgi:hypothetical protein